MNQVDRQVKSIPEVRFPVFEFLILFLPVAVLVLVVGFSFATLRTESQIEAILDDDETHLQHINGFVGAQLSAALNHLLTVAGEAVTVNAVSDPGARRLRALEATFLTLARRNPFYDQVRWIDSTGKERVRVSRGDQGPYVEPRTALQDKSGRYYFRVTRSLLPGEAYISPIDLNVEHGEIEIPAKPVLRVATPAIDDRREADGILLINLAMRRVFDAIDHLQQRHPSAHYLLVNRDGQVLNAPGGQRSDQSLAARSAVVWQQARRSASGSLETEDGLWTWRTYTPSDVLSSMRAAYPEHAAVVDQVVSDEFVLTLVAHRPMDFLLALRRDARMLVSLGTLLVLGIYGVAMYLYLNGHVRERRAQLHAGYAVARAENAERLKRLEERFHRLFEASNIGQLVVDADGNIEIGNPAAEKLLGYGAGGLAGLPVERLVPEASRDLHTRQREAYLEAPQAREMGAGRELQARRRDGGLVPVEIGLNPYRDDDRQLVLVSIIDLSRRR